MFTRFSLDYGEIFAILVTCGGVASRIEVVGRWVFVVSGDLVVVESDYRIRVCWLLDCWIFSLIGYMLGGGFIFFVFLFFVSLFFFFEFFLGGRGGAVGCVLRGLPFCV